MGSGGGGEVWVGLRRVQGRGFVVEVVAAAGWEGVVGGRRRGRRSS